MLSLRNSPIDSKELPNPPRLARTCEVTRHGHFWRSTFMAMGSPCELLCEADTATEAETLAQAVTSEAWRIADRFSRYIAGNIVDRINSASGVSVEVDEETASLIEFANFLYDTSDGHFDITSGVLRRVWTFDGSDSVPEKEKVLDIMEVVGWNKVIWRNRVLTM